ncbi:hypothetical protein O1L55_17615 [Streptomyces albulus]|nr:hypothetical protein [Streptomyces noursei]
MAAHRIAPTDVRCGTLQLNVWRSSTALVMPLVGRRTGTGPQRHSALSQPADLD